RIVGQRGEVAPCELAASLVHGLRREGEDVADGNRLVKIMERSGGADGAESAGSARVPAVDFIEAVACAELVAVVEAMIDFGEEIIGMDRVGVESGGDLRSLIANGLEMAVDGGNTGRRYSDESILIELPALEVGEVEGAVAQDRSCEAGSVLTLRDGKPALR